MGRKSINKTRKTDQEKRSKWTRKLYPFFRSNGLVGFSMDEVSEYLAISKATVYNHYTSKEEIIDCFLHEKKKDMDAFNKLIANPSVSFAERYQKALFHLLKHMCDVSPNVRHDLQYLYPEKWMFLSTLLDEYLKDLIKLYSQGMAEGVFNSINLRLLMICERNMLLFLSDSDQLATSGLSLRQAFDEFMNMRLTGIQRVDVYSEMKTGRFPDLAN